MTTRNAIPPIHVVGGGLAGSEAAWQLAAAGVPGGAARDAPGARHRGAPDRPAGRAGLLQLLPLRRCREQRRRPAARGDAALRLADHGGGRHATSCRPAARSPSTATASPPAVTGAAASAIRWSTHRARGGRRPAAGATGTRSSSPPARSPRPRWPSAIRALTGEECARLLRRHRADRAPRDASTSRRPGSSRATTRRARAATRADYINCPLDRDAVRGLRRGAAGRREDRVQGVGDDDALLRRLPADRGDGRRAAARRCASGR